MMPLIAGLWLGSPGARRSARRQRVSGGALRAWKSLALAFLTATVALSSAWGRQDPGCVRYQDYLRLIGTAYPPVYGCDAYGFIDLSLGEGVAVVCNLNYGLLVLDVKDPTRAVTVAQLQLPGIPMGVAVAGNVAVVASCAPNAVNIVDLSEPAAPALLASVATASGPRDVVVQGTLAYLACYDSPSGLLICDFSSPLAPALIGELVLPFPGATDVAIAGATLALACGDTIRRIDVSDATAPQETGALALPWKAHGIALDAGRAHVACEESDRATGGLIVVDLAGPALEVLASLPLDQRAYDVCLTRGLACVVDEYQGMAVFDVTDPGAPVHVAQAKTGDSRACCVASDGNTVFVGELGDCMHLGLRAGIYVFDVTHPNPAPLAGAIVDTFAYVSEIAAEGGLLVGAGYETFATYDVSDSQNPLRKGYLGVSGNPLGLGLGDGIACLASYDPWSEYDFVLRIIDVSVPEAPVARGRLGLSDWGYGVDVEGRRAYLANCQAGLVIVDLADLDAPAKIACLDPPGSSCAYDVAVLDGIACLADGQLRVIDVSDPYSPSLLATVPVAARAVAMDGRYAYTPGGIVDLAVPSSPAVVAMLPKWQLYCGKILAREGFVYLIGDRMQVVDARRPAAPVLLGSCLAGSTPYFSGYPFCGAFVGDVIALSGYGESIDLARPQCWGATGLAEPPAISSHAPALAAPNPFNPRTTIRFDLSAPGQVRLGVYDVRGRLVRMLIDDHLPSGHHQVVWDGKDRQDRSVGSGAYLARLEAGERAESVRLMLVR